MMNVIFSILKNVCALLYKQGGTALLIAVLFMFAWMYAYEKGWNGYDAVRRSVSAWIAYFRKSCKFRRVFLLTIYTSMMLLRTVLMREFYAHPLAKFMEGWGLYDEYGGMTAESIENIMLFIPFSFILMWVRSADVRGERVRKHRGIKEEALYAVGASAAFSFGIECVQLLIRCGTFQVSDLCYNILGGCVGAVCYIFVYLIYKKLKNK